MTASPRLRSSAVEKITADTVRADFNAPSAVVHYARAAHFLGLWQSERILIERFFPDLNAPLIEAGCGAGRVTVGLWHLGYRNLTAFDFAEELVDQARTLATERDAAPIAFHHADATRLTAHCHALNDKSPLTESRQTASSKPVENQVCHVIRDKLITPPGGFHGALFMFNGLMQIPGRDNRRTALRELRAVCRPGATFLFTTHDRNVTPAEQAQWRLESARWLAGRQDPRLVEYGDRYFEDESGRTFMHLPDREEILADLAASGWARHFDALRREIAKETRAVRDFSDECRFWVALAQ